MTGASAPNDADYYRRRCAELEGRLAKLEMENKELREENAKMREELLAFKATVTAVVARSIDRRQIKHGEEAL